MSCVREPILVINAGSSSCKFSIFETAPDRSLLPGAHGQVEGIGEAGETSRLEAADARGYNLINQPIASADHESAIAAIHAWFAAMSAARPDSRESATAWSMAA